MYLTLVSFCVKSGMHWNSDDASKDIRAGEITVNDCTTLNPYFPLHVNDVVDHKWKKYSRTYHDIRIVGRPQTERKKRGY